MNRKGIIMKKDFKMVLIGQIISLFGNSVIRFVLPLYLLNETGSAALFGLVAAVALIPAIILCPVGGILADRLNKRNIMVVLDFTTSAVILTFTLLLGRVNLVVLISCMMIILYGIQGTYQPAVQASVPALVDKDKIMTGNAFINIVSSLSGLIGPVIGGLLYASVGIYPILCLSAACFFASAVMEIFINIPYARKHSEYGVIRTGIDDMKTSLIFMVKDMPLIIQVCILFALVNLVFSACLQIGLPVVVTNDLGFSAEAAKRYYGYMEGMMGAGSLLGGALAGVLSKRLKPEINIYLLGACGVLLFPIGIVLNMRMSGIAAYLIIGGSVFAMMTCCVFLSVLMMSYLQMITPQDLIGKVISCTMCISSVAMPVGSAVYGVLFDRMAGNLQYIFICAGAVTVIVALAAVKPLRTIAGLLQPAS